jgi:hypothetical protein
MPVYLVGEEMTKSGTSGVIPPDEGCVGYISHSKLAAMAGELAAISRYQPQSAFVPVQNCDGDAA